MMIDSIKDFLKINTILDIDCNYEEISDNIDMYIGIDKDDNKIKQLRNNNFNKKNKIFITIDYVKEYLPKTDLVIMPKIEQDKIWLILEKIRQSEAKYFLSPIDLSIDPFYIPDTCICFLNNKKELLYLYSLKNVEFYLEELAPNISLLRKQLVPLLNEYLNKIYNTFLKYENGKNMFIANLINDKLLNWQKQYYDENVKKIVDDGIFDEYIDLLSLKYNNNFTKLNKIKDFLINEDFVWINILTKNYIKFFAKVNALI